MDTPAHPAGVSASSSSSAPGPERPDEPMSQDLPETERPQTRPDDAATTSAPPGHQPHTGTGQQHEPSGRDTAQQAPAEHIAEEPDSAEAAAEESSNTTPLTTHPTPEQPQSAPRGMTPSATQATPQHDDAEGTLPSNTAAARDKEAMPPPPSRTPQPGDTGPLTQAELQEIYNVIQNAEPQTLVSDLKRHFQGLHPDRRFTVAPLPQGATPIYVRQLRILLNPGESIPDDLINTWMWWFNLQQPAKGRMWVPQLGWAHTLVAPPANPCPAPAAGGRDRAATQPRVNTA